MQLLTLPISALILAHLSYGHPGESHHPARKTSHSKRNFYANTRHALTSCADKLQARGITAQAAARRLEIVERLSKRAVLVKKDTDAILNKSHHSSENYTLDTPYSDLFASNKSTCILNPEGEVGPYWVKGELIRSDLTDGESGVPLTIDGQVIDVETCEPVSGLYWDIWSCNSTGVYSGIQASGNGNSGDDSNLNNTALRGLQESNSDGVVQFTTIFPGHYTSRTAHIHMVAHINATLLANNTLAGGTIPHVGQFFFDQDLIDSIEATSPYSTNTQDFTTNAEDNVFVEQETENTDSDPVFEYVMLGDSLSDGLFAWITVVINTSATYDPSYAGVLSNADDVESTHFDASDGTVAGNGIMHEGGYGTLPSDDTLHGAVGVSDIPTDLTSADSLSITSFVDADVGVVVTTSGAGAPASAVESCSSILTSGVAATTTTTPTAIGGTLRRVLDILRWDL